MRPSCPVRQQAPQERQLRSSDTMEGVPHASGPGRWGSRGLASLASSARTAYPTAMTTPTGSPAKYLCLHCDKSFDHEGDAKPRCPFCMRVNGLEKVAEPSTAKGAPASLWLVAGAGLVVLGVGYAVFAMQSAPDLAAEVPQRPLTLRETQAYVEHKGVASRALCRILAAEGPAKALAERWEGRGVELAQGAFRFFRQRAQAGAFGPWSLGVPRPTPVATADQVAEWLAEPEGAARAGRPRQLYPLEVAALMAAGLRSRGVTAMVAEAYGFPGERTPPDPSGQLGYFVVAVYEGEAAEGTPQFFDPYGGRQTVPEPVEVLSDVSVVGAGLGLAALHRLSREGDVERALAASDEALRLYPRSATLRAGRAGVLVAAGQGEAGLRELESALQLRTDAPRHNQLASLSFRLMDLDAANRHVSSALEMSPDFAPGRVTLAMIHAARGELEAAEEELRRAEAIDPGWHELPFARANVWAMRGQRAEQMGRADRAEAAYARVLEYGQSVLEAHPHDLDARLRIGVLFRLAGRYDEMRRIARDVLERTPPSRRAEMTMVIQRMLGSTALEDPDEEVVAEEGLSDRDVEPEESGFQLDSPLLGGRLGRRGGGPSLLGDDVSLEGPGLSGAPAGLSGGSGGFRLREPGAPQ